MAKKEEREKIGTADAWVYIPKKDSREHWEVLKSMVEAYLRTKELSEKEEL